MEALAAARERTLVTSFPLLESAGETGGGGNGEQPHADDHPVVTEHPPVDLTQDVELSQDQEEQPAQGLGGLEALLGGDPPPAPEGE